MYCGECGTKNEEGAKVCKKCGKSLGFDVKSFLKEGAQKTKERFETLAEKDGKTYFNPRKYLSYASYFQVWVWIIYIVVVGGGFIFSATLASNISDSLQGLFIIIVGTTSAFIAAWIMTLFLKIKIQNMRWKVDIHSAIMKSTKEEK